MELQFRISSSQEHHKESIRHLLRLTEVPDPSAPPSCDAIELDSRSCRTALPSNTSDPFCEKHHKILEELNIRWNKLYQEAEEVVVLNLDAMKQKISKLRQSVTLRRQVRDRFYRHGGDIQDYIKWIEMLEVDITQLTASLLTQDPPVGGEIGTLKDFLWTDSAHRLYSIVPSLGNTRIQSGSPSQGGRATKDHGTDILRAWFRIMVFNDSDAAALELATRSKSIDEFLSGCHAGQLEMYCDFFENAWRPHAVKYLRVAICAQTLAGGNMKTIQFLGGMIPTTTEGLSMTKPCWDILYRLFPTLLTPFTIATICFNFEDYTTICRLLMLGLYRDYWYDPTSILNECATGVYMGFIPTSKGDFTSKSGLKQEGPLWVQHETRNYLCGQMGIGHPLTQAFLDELRKRTSRLFLVVYEGSFAEATVHPTEPDLFINRNRCADSLDKLGEAKYSVTFTLEDIKNQLRRRKTSVYDPIVVDSLQFIIIDRDIGRSFQLIEVVQDVLMMLTDDPSPRSIAKNVIREVIPPSVQEIFLKELQIEFSDELRYPAPVVQYEGNRYRCYKHDSGIMAAKQKRMKSNKFSRDANRFIRRVIEDMEQHGIIALAPEYEEPQTRPVIIQSSDGVRDLYFPYTQEQPSVEGKSGSSPLLPTVTSLLDFAQSYQKKHPGAIMAKGSIQTHYCAWPIPAIKSLGNTGTNFATWEGHVYHWKVMPFDHPSSAHAWQFYLQRFLNSKLRFANFHLTTFVICAKDRKDAEHNAASLLDEINDRGLKLTLPHIDEWTSNIDELKLETLYCGLAPA